MCIAERTSCHVACACRLAPKIAALHSTCNAIRLLCLGTCHCPLPWSCAHATFWPTWRSSWQVFANTRSAFIDHWTCLWLEQGDRTTKPSGSYVQNACMCLLSCRHGSTLSTQLLQDNVPIPSFSCTCVDIDGNFVVLPIGDHTESRIILNRCTGHSCTLSPAHASPTCRTYMYI